MDSQDLITMLENASYPISEEMIIWTAIFIAAIVIGVVSGFFVYHWTQYEMEAKWRNTFIWVYFSGAAVLSAVVLFSIINYLYF